jgi:hypothetical protein
VITLVVSLLPWDDRHADDAGVEYWPTITAYGQDQAPRPMPHVTGASTAAEIAWDFVEALLGRPAPAPAYRITITPAAPDEVEGDDE